MKSGNSSVDAMASVHIEGNIIPSEWNKTIVRPNGKPYLLAIFILADIVYWFRPTEVRDETDAKKIEYRKKFKGKTLVKSYQNYVDMTGESKRSVRAAFAALEDLGVISREMETIKCGENYVFSGNMFIYLNVDVLKTLMESDDYNSVADKEETGVPVEDYSEDRLIQKEERVLQNDVQGYDKKMYKGYEEPAGGGTERSITPIQVVAGGYTKECQETNTTPNIIANNTDIESNHIYLQEKPLMITADKVFCDEMDLMDNVNSYQALIRDNIEYDHHMQYDSYGDKEIYDELYKVICDVVCVRRDKIKINQNLYPYEMVKSVFLKLNSFHLEYVMDSLKNTTSDIKNIRQYLITSLYNAYLSMNAHYQQKVQHDQTSYYATHISDNQISDDSDSKSRYDFEELERILVSNGT